jgi:long-chain fatty acid transport protein
VKQPVLYGQRDWGYSERNQYIEESQSMNKQKVLARIIPALLACTASGYASASGFQLLEQNASGIGNAFAGSAAVADNASTVYFNPAGMTQLEGRNISAGVTAIDPTYNFNNGNSSSLNGLTNAGSGGNAGHMAYLPNGYFSMALNKDLYLGLGIGAPFGLKTEYANPWVGAAQSISFEVKTLNINPSVAYRVNDTVSLGFGLDWQKLNAKYKRLAGTRTNMVVAAGPVLASTTGVTNVLDISDDAWGWNAGVLFNVSPATKVGISYRSAIKYTATGTAAMSGDGSAAATVALNTLAGVIGGTSANVKADVKLPDTWIFSASHKLNDQWELLGDLSRTGWSSIPKIDIVYTSGTRSGSVGQTLNTDFRDAWRVAFGANYKYSDALKLKFGVAYDETPVKGADTRMVSLPDNNRTWLSFGVQYLPAKGQTLDVGFSRLFIKDAPVNNDQTSVVPITNAQTAALNTLSQRGLINGSYSGKIWLLGAQYSVSF